MEGGDTAPRMLQWDFPCPIFLQEQGTAYNEMVVWWLRKCLVDYIFHDRHEAPSASVPVPCVDNIGRGIFRGGGGVLP